MRKRKTSKELDKALDYLLKRKPAAEPAEDEQNHAGHLIRDGKCINCGLSQVDTVFVLCGQEEPATQEAPAVPQITEEPFWVGEGRRAIKKNVELRAEIAALTDKLAEAERKVRQYECGVRNASAGLKPADEVLLDNRKGGR